MPPFSERFLLAMVLLLATGTPLAGAGTLTNGSWAPAGCGTKPEPVSLDLGDVKAYNESVKKVQDWQKLAQAYNNCFVREANADAATIIKTSSDAQREFQAAVAKINADAATATAKFGGKKAPQAPGGSMASDFPAMPQGSTRGR
jgi:hypothetical protein